MTVKLTLCRAVDRIIFPLLLILSLDTSMLFSCILFGIFSALTHFSKSFSLTLIRFWQSSAIIVSLLWLLNHVYEINISFSVLLFLLLALWSLYCLFGSKFETVFSTGRFEALNFFGLFMSFSFVFLLGPRNILQQFAMLEAEDQENWMYPIVDSLNDIKSMFDVPFGSQGVQFFTRFVVSAFGKIGQLGHGDESRLYLIESVSNAWLFLLVSSIVLVNVLLSMLVRKHLSPNRFFLLSVTATIFLLIFFRSSLFFGHLSQFLLSVVIFSFLISLLSRKLDTNNKTLIFDRCASVALAWSFVGSYNPWLPVALVAICLAVIAEVPALAIRKLLSNWIVMVFLLIFVGAGFFLGFEIVAKRFHGLHDQGGVWPIRPSAVVLFLMFGISILVARFSPSRLKSDFGRPKDEPTDLIWSWTMTAPIFLILTFLVSVPSLSNLSEIDYSWFASRVQLISVVIIFGLLILPSTTRCIREFFQDKGASFVHREFLLLGLASLFFVVFIWTLSLGTGSGKPMYAAEKSALSLFQQFYWLILVFLFIRGRFLSRGQFALYYSTIIVALTLSLGLYPLAKQVMLVKPLSETHGLYDPWWRNEVITELERDYDAVIVCVGGDLNVSDYNVYACNRFLQTLTKLNYPASGFRYLFWHQPEEYKKIQAFFDSSHHLGRVVVIARESPSDEIMKIFRSVDGDQLVFVRDTR